MTTGRARGSVMTSRSGLRTIIRVRKALVALTLLGFVYLPIAAVPVSSAAERSSRQASQPTIHLNADQAAERAREQTGGHVVNIHQQPHGYWVRMLSARGQVRDIWIPSANR